MRIELDAAQAAAREASGDDHELVMWGESWFLPAALTPFVGVYLDAGEYPKAFEHLLGPEQYERFIAKRPTSDDLTVFLTGMAQAYGIPLPKSSASVKPSARTGRPSKPTSKGSTASTSRKSDRRAVS